MKTPIPDRPDAPEPDAGPDVAKVAAMAAAALGLTLALAALALFGTRAAFSVVAGATIAVANLVTMSAIIRAMLRPAEEEAAAQAAAARAAASAGPDPDGKEDEAPPPADHAAEGKRGGAAWGLFAVLKILVLFGGVWVLLTRGMVDPIPLVVGYGVLPLGIATSSLFTSLFPRARPRPRSPRSQPPENRN